MKTVFFRYVFFFKKKKHHLIKCGELSRPAQHFGCFLSPATSVTSAPENISLEWLILRMNNGNCYRACREILVIQASTPKPKHAHTRTPLSFNPSIHPHLLASRHQWEWARLKCRYESVALSRRETRPSDVSIHSQSRGVRQPSVLNYTSHQKCCQMQSHPPVSGVYADAVASSKFEVGVGGRWISLGVIAKAEAYPFLSAVTPQKN